MIALSKSIRKWRVPGLFLSPIELAVAATMVASFALAQQQQDFSKVEIVPTKLSEDLWALAGQGGNIAVSAGPDGVLLVDDQFAPLSGKIRAAVEKISPKPIKFLVNTHWHGDHTGGNEAFAKGGTLIFAQDNVRKRLATGAFIEALNRNVPPAPQAALPVVTFSETLTFHFNGEDVEVFHVAPAHTDGDSVIHFVKDDVYHTGDVFNSEGYPFIDVSSGGSLEGLVVVNDLLLGRVDDKAKLIPGHGKVGDKSVMKEYRDMLAAIRDRVGELIKQGKSADETVAAHPSADYDGKWGKGFMNGDKFVKMAYQSMKR